MGLTKYKLGELITQSTANNRNLQYGIEKIVGVSSEGIFTAPKGEPIDVDLRPYKIVDNGAFVYTPTRVNIGSLAYRTQGLCIVSHLYVVFYLSEKGKKLLDPIWLYIYLRRKEFGREIDFRLFGSARPEFSYRDMADTDISLPDIEVQRRFVSVFLSLRNNLAIYQSKTEELKLVCDGYLDQMKTKSDILELRAFIEQCDERNINGVYCLDDLRGVSIEKRFIESKADMMGVSLLPYAIVRPEYFVFVPVTSRNGEKITLAMNDSNETYIVSSAYTVFRVKDKQKLLPDYLFMIFNRPEFDRYARFNSWGSAREVFTMDDMNDVEIPIPDISVQQEIVNIHKCYIERQRIASRLKEQLNNLCPILIKGSLETSS